MMSIPFSAKTFYKTSAILLLIVVMLTQCSFPRSRFELRDFQSVEGIHIGMDMNKAIKKLERKYRVEKRKNSLIDSGDEFIYQVFGKNEQPLIEFNSGFSGLDQTKVFRIVLLSSKYKTPDGAHSEMKLGELRKSAKLSTADFNFTDGLFIRAADFDGGYWMNLQDRNTENLKLHPPVIKELPSDLKVKAIILF